MFKIIKNNIFSIQFFFELKNNIKYQCKDLQANKPL